MAYVNLPAAFNSNQTSFGTAENIDSVVDSVETAFGTLNSSIGKVARLNTTLKYSGLKDGSGASGDFFKEDSSLYIKISSGWCHIPCASLGLGT